MIVYVAVPLPQQHPRVVMHVSESLGTLIRTLGEELGLPCRALAVATTTDPPLHRARELGWYDLGMDQTAPHPPWPEVHYGESAQVIHATFPSGELRITQVGVLLADDEPPRWPKHTPWLDPS
jgi:hypothetical protein